MRIVDPAGHKIVQGKAAARGRNEVAVDVDDELSVISGKHAYGTVDASWDNRGVGLDATVKGVERRGDGLRLSRGKNRKGR